MIVRFSFGIALCFCALATQRIQAQIPQPSPNAKACAYLPMADLEAHFGMPPKIVSGIDQPARYTCAANFPTPMQAAVLESHPPNAADQAMTAAQRLAVIKGAFKNSELKDFGSVGCLRAVVDMGKPVHETTCFLSKAAYLSLSLKSEDVARVSFEAVKSLLEKAAARRK